jgi:ribosomal protein L37AE/L43A
MPELTVTEPIVHCPQCGRATERVERYGGWLCKVCSRVTTILSGTPTVTTTQEAAIRERFSDRMVEEDLHSLIDDVEELMRNAPAKVAASGAEDWLGLAKQCLQHALRIVAKDSGGKELAP